MAINKTIELDTGIEVSHHVFDLNFDNVHNQVTIVWEQYRNATKYKNGKRPVEVGTKFFQLKDIPATVKTKLLEVLAEMETFMLTNDSDFIGGKRVKDNGNPI
jgi:hypothetical protein